MATHHYSNYIKIVDFEGTALGNGNLMTFANWNTFRDRVSDLLDIIGPTRTGRKLFAAMQSTGKTVTIFSGTNMDKSIAKKNPETDAAGIAAMPVQFRPTHKNLPLSAKGQDADYQQAKQREQQLGEANPFKAIRTATKLQMAGLGQPQTPHQAIPALVAVLNRAHLGMALDPRITQSHFRHPNVEIPRRLNISVNEFDEMCVGLRKFPDDVYYPTCFLLYDFLTPGAGCDSQIRLATAACFNYDFAADIAGEKKLGRGTAKTAPLVEAVVLAHELIHAWRMMAGRRVVFNGWEEEAMTSGIGPFANWQLTENHFRSDLSLKRRKTYLDNTCSSELAIGIRDETNTGSYRGIMF